MDAISPQSAAGSSSYVETSAELEAYARRTLRRRAVSLTITVDAGSFVHGQTVDLDITGAPDLNGVWTVADVRPEDGDCGVTFGRVRVDPDARCRAERGRSMTGNASYLRDANGGASAVRHGLSWRCPVLAAYHLGSQPGTVRGRPRR